MGIRALVAIAVVLVAAACGRDADIAPPSTTTSTAETEAGWAEYTTDTPSYRLLLRTGPPVTMEVMMAGATMTQVDQGNPVNHHVEVHIFERGTGAETQDPIPTLRITNQATGETRQFPAQPDPSGEIPYLTACLLTNHRVTEPHFGDNLYLADGNYMVTVTVGNEEAEIEITVHEEA